jgi:hypothetical protein
MLTIEKSADLFNKNKLTLFSIMNEHNGPIHHLLLSTLRLYKKRAQTDSSQDERP